MAKTRSPLFWLGCGLLAAFALAAALAPWLAPYDPRLPTGRPLAPPSREHLLGTNDLGQDVLSQVVFGARSSLIVAGAVTFLSAALSWIVGLTAGFFRRAEAPLMAATDLLLALPTIPLLLLVLTLLGPGRRNLILVLALLSWPAFARVVRGIILRVRSAPYVEASRALGAPGTHLVLQHLLPATLTALPTKLVLTVRFAVFAEATLAFLGLGSGDAGSWGMMLNWAFSDPLLFSRSIWPWLVLPPTLAIVALVLAIAWVSDRATAPRPGRFSHHGRGWRRRGRARPRARSAAGRARDRAASSPPSPS